MSMREGSWWSRSWGTLALAAFALHLGATAYEDAILAPLWLGDPPSSVTAWRDLALRPDSSNLFQALTVIILVTTAMSWMSGLSARGWRRWWLTLSLACAVALAAVTYLFVVPSERWLFGDGAKNANDAVVVAWTGEWLRAAVMRAAALVAGAWSLYRAQLSVVAYAVAVEADFELGISPPAARPRRVREFVFGDEQGPEITIPEDTINPRQRWRGSLPGPRRTAKK